MEADLLAHADWLHRLARALVGEGAAADLVQDTYETALTDPPEREGALRPWLGGVARNLSRMRARSAARRAKREEAAAVTGEAPSPEELVARVEMQQLVARVVMELDEPYRSTLLLRFFEGLSAADIARAQNVPAGTVRWRLKEALDQVRAQLDALHGGQRKRWAALLAPLAGTAKGGAASTLLVGGIAVKTALKIGALIALVLAIVLGTRMMGWWGGGKKAGAGSGSGSEVANAPPAKPTHDGIQRSPGAAAAPGALELRDDDPRGTLRLEGQVIDEDDQPVGGARVAIDANPARVAVTEADGSFAFDGLIARDYRLEATAGDGYAGPARLRMKPNAEPVTLRMHAGGVVEVAVTAADGGAPIAGAEVELRSMLTWTAVTGADGLAVLRGVGPTWAPLVARAGGYAQAAMMIHTSGDAQRTERLAITLSRGAAVSGRVVDDAGAPVAGARVHAAAASEPFPVFDRHRDGVATGADGTFTLPALAAGTYRLTASDAEHGPATSSPFIVDGVHPRDGLELVMTAGAEVRGVVRDGAGKPLAAADVRVVGSGTVDWRFRRQAFTDEKGRFVVTGLPRRAVEVVAWHPAGSSAIVPIDLVAERAKEVTLTIDVTGAIEGTVVDSAGQPLGDAQVIAEPAFSGGVEDRQVWSVRGVQEEMSDAAGHFRIAGLPDGTYTLRAARAGASEAALWLGDGVSAKPGDMAVKLVLADPGGVAGKVAMKDGTAVKVFTVSVDATDDVPFASKDGDFTLDAPAGSHRITVSGPGFIPTVLRDVKVAEGTMTDLGTISVEPGRSVSGRVLDTSGAPVAAAIVAAGRLLSGGGAELYIESESIGAHSVETDDDGRFVLPGYDNGPITLVAGKDGVGRSASFALPRGSDSVSIDLVLAPVGSVSGTITKQGKPLPDTIVIMNPVGATASNFFVVTGPDGTFALDAVSPGPYVIYPMIGGGGPRPKDMFVRGIDVTAGERAQVTIDVPVGSVTLNLAVTKGGAPAAFAQVVVVQAKIDAPTIERLRDGSWLPAELFHGTIAAMYMRAAMGGPVEIAAMVPGDYTACAIPVDDPSSAMDHLEELPMVCSPLTVTAAPAAQSLTLSAP